MAVRVAARPGGRHVRQTKEPVSWVQLAISALREVAQPVSTAVS